MIYYDKYDLPVNQFQDGGDSCVRAGLLSMVNPREYSTLGYYEIKPGMFVRHPIQEPWNNPNNFTRDQMMCLLAGADRADDFYFYRTLAQRMFWSRFKAFPWLLGLVCFSQSTERDKSGSKKMFWPHSNWKDSNPTPETFPMKWSWKELQFTPIIKTVLVAETKLYIVEDRLADGPDPLFPNHMGAMIIAGRMWYLYPLLLIAYPVHLLFLLLHSRSKHFEENQQIAECSIFGTKKILKLLKPHWEANSLKYWQDRNEVEYHTKLVEFMK